MIKKLSRKKCIELYPSFPLREYNEESEDYEFEYPTTYANYWLSIESKTNIQHKKNLAVEVEKLYKELKVEKLIFLCDYKSTWITRNSRDRTDFKQLIKAVDYLKDNKIGLKFDGGLIVEMKEIKKFIEHFYILTMCDGLFAYYHFLDENQSILGYIHYDGELQLNPMNIKMDKKLKQAFKLTNLKDAERKNTNRI